MAKAIYTSMTRRDVFAGLAVAAAATAVLAGADNANAQEKSLYERLGASSPSRPWWITLVTPS